MARVKAGRFRQYVGDLPSHATGGVVTRWGQTKFNELCGGNEEHGLVLFNALRNEVGRASEAKHQAARRQRGVERTKWD